MKNQNKIKSFIDKFINAGSSMFPYVAITCLIWYLLDVDLNTHILAQYHLVFTGVCAFCKLMKR